MNEESPADVPASGRVSAWLSEIERAFNGEGMSKYNDRCRIIRKRYRYEGSAFVRSRKYQLLWSNIETMKSAVYSKPPHGTVSRRYRDSDPVGRVATEVLERAINFSFDASNFDGVFKQVRDDFLLYGRGCARIYYEPEYETEDDLNEDIEDAEDTNPTSRLRTRGAAASDNGGAKPGLSKSAGDGTESKQSLAFENVRIRFVQRADFRHQQARTWEEVQWIAFRAFLTRAEVTERFGKEIGEQIGLDSDPSETEDNEKAASNPAAKEGAKATVWEIWDKAKNQVLWIAKNWPDVLEEGEPYLLLDGFYPCPRPAYGTLTPDSLVPVPDYVFYQDQCEEIDQLTARIGALSDSLKLVGFYPAGPQGEGSPEVEKALSPGFENKLIAVHSWSAFKEGGGGGVPVIWLPIDQVIKILEGCVTLRKQLVEDVHQITGLSDIMRGATDPQETEGAQQLKAQFGGTRIRDRQQEIARFCRDVSRLCGQVIAMYCSPTTIMKMTNMNLPTRQDVMMAQLAAQQQAQRQAAMMAMLQAQGGMQNGQAVGGLAQGPGINGPQRPPAPMGGSGANDNALPQGGGGALSTGFPGAPSQSSPVNLGPTQEDVFGLLKDALIRRFKIDIENDSTISGDESQERQDRSQFIEAVTKFMEAWGPMVIQKPELGPLAGQLLLFGVRAFRIGRELEETIEETTEKLKSLPPSQPGSDPKIQAEKIKLQGTQAKTQAEIQKSKIDGHVAQMSAQQKMQETQVESAAKIEELRMKLAVAEQEHQHKTAEAGLAHGAAMDKMQLERQKQASAAAQAAAKPPTWPTNQPGF
jgi:hypothetical protein